MRTYFKSGGKLIRYEVDTDDIGIAQVETYLAAVEQDLKPDTTVLAVIPGERS